MISQKLSIGIMSCSPEFRNFLKDRAEGTRQALVTISADEYCKAEDDYPSRRFAEAGPDIILVELDGQGAAIKALGVLHALLPETWLCACGLANDTQLIIEAMAAGARDFLPKPVSCSNLAMGFSRYLEEKARLQKDNNSGKIYSITPAKGGAGATSVVINMAIALADMPGTKVAILDLNSPGDLPAYLNIEPRFCLEDAIKAPKLDTALLETLMTKVLNISLLPSLGHFKTGASTLAKLLRVAGSTYTHTFIDLPYYLDLELLQTATGASESVLVVITPELPVVWRADRYLSVLTGCGCGERIRLILNRGNSRSTIDKKEITKALKRPLYWILPNNYRTAVHAINSSSAMVAQRHSNISASYRDLTWDLTGMSFSEKRSGLSELLGGSKVPRSVHPNAYPSLNSLVRSQS
jgi:pilus assembly protein CpaE